MVGTGPRALLCVLVVTGLLIAVGPSAVALADPGSPLDAVQEEQEPDENDDGLTLDDADNIHIEIQLAENGSATVVTDYRYQLGNDSEAEAEWEQFESDVESNPETYIDAEAQRWQETAEEGENRTGREMNVSSFTVDTDRSSTPREYGHVEFTFEWSSFAYVELNRLEAGDALVGVMLDEDTQLQMTWPDTYNVTGYDPEPDSLGETSILWTGDGTSFDDDQPRVELIEAGTEGTEVPADEGFPWEWVVVALAVVMVVTLVVVAGLLFRRDTRYPPPAPETAESSMNGQPETLSTPPPELLSNEERVLRLLEQRGGRLKQQQVVSELEWTEAKTSQVVSSLREDDEIDVFKIGRENVLTLPEESEQSQEP